MISLFKKSIKEEQFDFFNPDNINGISMMCTELSSDRKIFHAHIRYKNGNKTAEIKIDGVSMIDLIEKASSYLVTT